MASGRNDRCPCGSGKKFKACCGRIDRAATAGSPAPAGDGPSAMASPEPLTPTQLAQIAARVAARQFGALEREAGALTSSYPHSGLAWKALGLALMAQEKDALGALQKAAALRPNDPEVHGNLGNALQTAERRADAIASYQRAIALAPNYADMYSNLGTLYRLQGQTRLAEQSARQALQLNPKSAAATALLAALHADRGQFAEAESLCRQALALDPSSPQALADMVYLRRMTARDASWLVTAQRFLTTPMPPRREAYLQYAIGKYHDDLHEYAAAFASYRRANVLVRRSGPAYDRVGLSRAVDLAIHCFDRTWLERLPGDAEASERPVFIVGMPRSGTSLAEQILASHPRVYGAGELDYWSTQPQVVNSLLRPAAIDSAQLHHMARGYLQLLQRLSVNAARVIDKMPSNFLYLGLIHAALPKAKILHMRRDPIDTCLSIYFQNFGSLHSYATDLDDLAHYYREYRRLLAHWRAILPATTLLDVPYEALVADPGTWTRTIVDFTGLPWNERCLAFQETERSVITASKWQVRQRISRSSVERWRNYKEFIAPLLPLAAEGSG